MYPNKVKCRLVKGIGLIVHIGQMWKTKNQLCMGDWELHSARTEAERFLFNDQIENTYMREFKFKEYPDIPFPTICERCGKSINDDSYDFSHFKGTEFIYNTEDGKKHSGDMWWNYGYPENFFWDNHKGPHLMVLLPNGHDWNIDSRARNCTKKDDKTHRCWVRTGEPPNVTAGKNGPTCDAGAGSIQSGDYHGFLEKGYIVTSRELA